MFRAFAIVIVIFGELPCFDALRQPPFFPLNLYHSYRSKLNLIYDSISFEMQQPVFFPSLKMSLSSPFITIFKLCR